MWYMRHVIMRTTVATIQGPAADDDDGDDDDDATTRIAHDAYDRHETKTHNSWSHFWGKFQTHAFVIYDTYCT